MIIKTFLAGLPLMILFLSCRGNNISDDLKTASPETDTLINSQTSEPEKPAIDTADFHARNLLLANKDTIKWPVKNQPLPLPGAILPFNRVIAYYGNLYSTRMGVLGEFPKPVMLKKLLAEVEKWNKADSHFNAIPALHYICVTAQGSAGADGKYRARMPHHQIDSILNWAKEIDALVFLDIQVGLSSIEKEIPLLEKYLSLPNVHLGIDPEFSMKTGQRPGTVIGSFDQNDINFASNYLKQLVIKHNLPPKMLVVHRFTQKMVQGYKQIKLHPEVQIIMDMDGWGEPARKMNTYRLFVQGEPVQYTGFKIFYKNDTKRVNRAKEMQPEDVLKLSPIPIYIQYQ